VYYEISIERRACSSLLSFYIEPLYVSNREKVVGSLIKCRMLDTPLNVYIWHAFDTKKGNRYDALVNEFCCSIC
jgi:hypothetical protein